MIRAPASAKVMNRVAANHQRTHAGAGSLRLRRRSQTAKAISPAPAAIQQAAVASLRTRSSMSQQVRRSSM